MQYPENTEIVKRIKPTNVVRLSEWEWLQATFTLTLTHVLRSL